MSTAQFFIILAVITLAPKMSAGLANAVGLLYLVLATGSLYLEWKKS